MVVVAAAATRTITTILVVVIVALSFARIRRSPSARRRDRAGIHRMPGTFGSLPFRHLESRHVSTHRSEELLSMVVIE